MSLDALSFLKFSDEVVDYPPKGETKRRICIAERSAPPCIHPSFFILRDRLARKLPSSLQRIQRCFNQSIVEKRRELFSSASDNEVAAAIE